MTKLNSPENAPLLVSPKASTLSFRLSMLQAKTAMTKDLNGAALMARTNFSSVASAGARSWARFGSVMRKTPSGGFSASQNKTVRLAML